MEKLAVFLSLEGKKIVVVGGGNAALIKIKTLLEIQADFEVISKQYLQQTEKILKDNNFLQSMSRKGTPIDNAPTESFFSTLKSELIYNKTINIPNDKVLIQEIIDYIYYYNNERIQKSLGYLTPIEFKKKYQKENDKSI